MLTAGWLIGVSESMCQVAGLRDKFHIYCTEDGRFSMAGVTTKNVAYIASAVHECCKLQLTVQFTALLAKANENKSPFIEEFLDSSYSIYHSFNLT